MRRQRRQQGGQALIEAAFAVPIMVLMVFGTFYVTYAYMQRSILNGAAFMAARAVSVRPPGEANNLAKTVVARMAHNAKLGKDHWLNRAPVSGHPQQGVHMEEPDGMWSFLARIADTAAAGKGRHQQVDIQLAPEFRRISSTGRSTQTYHLISYSVNEADAYEAALQVFKGALKSDPDKRIGEPDSTTAVGQAVIIGGIDSLGGTIYTRNTSKLDVHKRHIGLRGVPPDDNDTEIDPRKQFLPGGPLHKLELMGKMFDTIEAAQGVVTVVLPQAEALAEAFKPFYGVYVQGRDIVFDTGLKTIQEQQTLVLSPGSR